MAKHKYNLCVVSGKYTTKEGLEKKKWENVGKVITSENGGDLYFIKKTFNPAGVFSEKPGDDMVMISRFEVRESSSLNASSTTPAQPATQEPPFDDEVPF